MDDTLTDEAANRDGRDRARRKTKRSGPATRSWCGRARPIGTKVSSTMRCTSTWAVIPIRISPSVTASTSAWARTCATRDARGVRGAVARLWLDRAGGPGRVDAEQPSQRGAPPARAVLPACEPETRPYTATIERLMNSQPARPAAKIPSMSRSASSAVINPGPTSWGATARRGNRPDGFGSISGSHSVQRWVAAVQSSSTSPASRQRLSRRPPAAADGPRLLMKHAPQSLAQLQVVQIGGEGAPVGVDETQPAAGSHDAHDVAHGHADVGDPLQHTLGTTGVERVVGKVQRGGVADMEVHRHGLALARRAPRPASRRWRRPRSPSRRRRRTRRPCRPFHSRRRAAVRSPPWRGARAPRSAIAPRPAIGRSAPFPRRASTCRAARRRW